VTAFTSGTLEIEFTAGSWTNVSAYYDLNQGVRIEHGRKTEFDDVQPATLTVFLWNDDGRFMPELPSSPYYPNMVEGKRIRWKVSILGVTYTRFTGWIQEIQAAFPSSNTVGSQVAIFAVDALGLLGQRKLRSNATERALYNARNAGTWCDAFEFPGSANGLGNAGTNYSTDAFPGDRWLAAERGVADTDVLIGCGRVHWQCHGHESGQLPGLEPPPHGVPDEPHTHSDDDPLPEGLGRFRWPTEPRLIL
jgi:hypothetical protein